MAKNNKQCADRENIIIQGARVNNLKNINIKIPKNKLVVVTGLSGSGKSSLAFDTIYSEGNRRYMESLSSFARNFLNVSSKPDVDRIENLSPPISIDQKSIARSPRSTVGTLTEIYDYLRILFAKVGSIHCPKCGVLMQKKSNNEILEDIFQMPDKSQLAILAKIDEKNKNIKEVLRSVQQLGYARVRFEGRIITVSEAMMDIEEDFSGGIDIVIDRIEINKDNFDKERILDSIESAMKIGKGSMILTKDGIDNNYNRDFICNACGVHIKEISPRHFSFNSPEGACSECSGLGVKMEIDPDLVIPNKNLSLSEGAVQFWSKSGGKNGNGGQLSVLDEVGKMYGFSIDDPMKRISADSTRIILYGEESIEKRKKNDLGGVLKVPLFEGIITMLERKYLETKSDYMRREIERYMNSQVCPECHGKRLKKEYLSVLVGGKSIDYFSQMGVSDLKVFVENFENWKLSKEGKDVSRVLIKEIADRLNALEDVGLEYLTMSRSAETISGGEAQRIRLAVQIKSQLSGLIYVLDEPSVGLHSRDTEKLIGTMKSLRDVGNSLVVVEHDSEIMKASDWIVDMGPGAGEEGGEIIFEGTSRDLLRSKSLTASFLNGKEKIFNRKKARSRAKKNLEIIKASENNLKNVDVSIPLERFVAVCGVSGSGKSTLVNDILARALSKYFFKSKAVPGKHKTIKGLGNINKVININQDPIGQTPRSNAATYTGVFSHIRDLFSSTQEAQSRGYTSSQFSFNMKGGRCEVCQGDGLRRIEMHLLPDMYVRCEACDGTRYNRKTLEIEYQGANIAQVLDMSVSYALRFFKKHRLITEKLQTMEDVGLGYLRLGQSATNLSGGEAQRIKLSTELSRKSTGKTLYILDEPTIGLHFDDVRRLLLVLDALVEKGNSVLVVEHNLDVIRNADWVIELGPEGGNAGGELVFEGLPEQLKKNKKSWTAKYI